MKREICKTTILNRENLKNDNLAKETYETFTIMNREI
jgi:hypothetical protein